MAVSERLYCIEQGTRIQERPWGVFRAFSVQSSTEPINGISKAGRRLTTNQPRIDWRKKPDTAIQPLRLRRQFESSSPGTMLEPENPSRGSHLVLKTFEKRLTALKMRSPRLYSPHERYHQLPAPFSNFSH